MAELQFFSVATTGDIEPGEVFISNVEGEQLAVCNVDGEFYAIQDACTHDGASFDQTDLEGTEIFCPRHGAIFDVTNGAVLGAPASDPVRTFPVRVEGDTIKVGLER